MSKYPTISFMEQLPGLPHLHPVNHALYTFAFPEGGIVVFRLQVRSRSAIYLAELMSLHQEQGFGRRAMEALCQHADQYDVTLGLLAQPFGGRPMTVAKLRRFYGDYGFSGPDYTAAMMRKPNQHLMLGTMKDYFDATSSARNGL